MAKPAEVYPGRFFGVCRFIWGRGADFDACTMFDCIMASKGSGMRRQRRMLAAALAVMVVALAGLAPAALANHTTINWEGQDWEIDHDGIAAVDANGDLTITRTSGTGDVELHVNRIAPTSGGDSFINANGTPWILVSYLDNGESRGVDFFIDDEIHPLNPRLQAGSLFSCSGLGYVRYGPGTEEIVFAEGCDPSTRAAGQAHTIYVGQRADGTIDYNFDGIWYSSTFLKDNTGPFDFNDVYLRLRGASGTSATFTDFQYGDNHISSKDDCKGGGWQDYGPVFKNQGQCIKFVNTGE